MENLKVQRKVIAGNRVIWLLTVSDIFNWGLYMVITGIAAIYLESKLGENTVQYIGIGVSIYLVSRALFQLPMAIISDRIKSDRDEIFLLAFGNFLMGVPFVFYPLIQGPAMYFFLQMLFGLGAAANLNNWRKLFARNLDKGQEGKEYAVYDLIMCMATAGFATIAGLVASINMELFDTVMYITGFVMMASCIWPLLIFTIKQRNSIVIDRVNNE